MKRINRVRKLTKQAVGDCGQRVLVECEGDGCHLVTRFVVDSCPGCGEDVTLVAWETCECDNTHTQNKTVCRYCSAKKDESKDSPS